MPFMTGDPFCDILILVIYIIFKIVSEVIKFIAGSFCLLLNIIIEPDIVGHPHLLEDRRGEFGLYLNNLFRFYQSIWNILKDLWKCICFLFSHDESAALEQTCDACKLHDEGIVRYCQECKLFVCSRCYSIHQQFSSCRDHQTSTCKEKQIGPREIPLSRRHLEVNSMKDVEIEDDVSNCKEYLSVSFIKLKNTIALCIYCLHGNLFFENIEGEKPNYMLRNVFHYWDPDYTITYLPYSGFVFVATKHTFKATYVPFHEKMKNFSKIISNQFSKIRYQLNVSESPPCLKEIEETLSGQTGVVHLYTEFDNGIAVLLYKEDNFRFGLVLKWYIMFYSHEGKFKHKCYLKESLDGEAFAQNPACMTATLHNTLVICGSAEVTEVDIDGNIMFKVNNMKDNISGSITAVTSDNEANIYISGKEEVVQISNNSRTIRKILSTNTENGPEYIEDISFSVKTRKLHVVTKNRQSSTGFNLVSFKFI